MTTFDVETDRRTEVRDVTDRVEAALAGDADGVATVFTRHTTAGVAVNEAEPRLMEDVESALGGLVAVRAGRARRRRGLGARRPRRERRRAPAGVARRARGDGAGQ